VDKIVEARRPFGKASFCLVKFEGVDLVFILCVNYEYEDFFLCQD
jgi:hypothetical protein